MNHNDLETIYDYLAVKLDEVGEEQTPLFLSKLALLLAREVNDVPTVKALIDNASSFQSGDS